MYPINIPEQDANNELTCRGWVPKFATGLYIIIKNEFMFNFLTSLFLMFKICCLVSLAIWSLDCLFFLKSVISLLTEPTFLPALRFACKFLAELRILCWTNLVSTTGRFVTTYQNYQKNICNLFQTQNLFATHGLSE